MYKLHLILKYLRKRRIAWVSLVAVTLCTAMVIVVISVMGGWLRMFRESFHGMSGDVIVHGQSKTGFPYYQEMIDRIERLPEVEAAAPVIDTFGLINIKDVIRDGVRVLGFPMDKIVGVNRFADSLDRMKSNPTFALLNDIPYEIHGGGKNPRNNPGMIVGAGVARIRKNQDGTLERPAGLYTAWTTLTVLGISADKHNVEVTDVANIPYWIVDFSRTQIWQYDSNTVYVPFDRLQRDMKMEAYGDEPSRTNDIQIKVKAGVDLNDAKKKIDAIVQDVKQQREISFQYPIHVETWEESQSMFIGAIEKEKVLMTFLFGIISLVSVFLIFCIFFMIVVEKTRDIGIIKSVGATSAGVAGIFLGYGLAIGIVGGGLGLLAGYEVVHNINSLHEEMGRLLGIQIWNPEVYAFDTIPNSMNPKEIAIIVGVAILSSVLGALVPALRAAGMNPVEAVRWE